MSQPNKKAATAVEVPLNDHEINHVCGLLHRAISFDQGQKVLNAFRDTLTPKGNHVPAMYMLGEMKKMYETEKGYLNVNSTMSDASKRRLSEDAKEAEDEASISDWSTCGFEGPSKVGNAYLVGA